MQSVAITVLCVLSMIYAAAFLLALRDKIKPPVPDIPNLPRRRLKRWQYVVLVGPLAVFALAIWAVLEGPVVIWRKVRQLLA